MNNLRELWENKRDAKGRIDITIFFINIFLLMTHIFLMIIYMIVRHDFMIVMNLISLIYYSMCFFACYKHKDTYIGFTFLEIWIHMLCGMCSFGWHAAFQNWIFALIVGTFLPSFKSDGYKPNYARSFIYTGIVIISYFVFSVLIHVIPMSIYTEVSGVILRTVFTFNNMITFAAIIMFAVFYTIRNENRVYELTRKADYDELTSLYNRYSLNTIGTRISSDAKKMRKQYAVAIIDIDFFKKINDTYGHAAGDDVLKELANILRSYSVRGIISGRWGGEEFLMIAPSSVTYSEFIIVLEKLREKVGKVKFQLDDNLEINMTISIGAAPIDYKTKLEDAVTLADKNLYIAKETGRNKLVS